jgi:exopolysaccharide production protein ExoQ
MTPTLDTTAGEAPPLRARARGVEREIPVWQIIETWIVFIPLSFFAARGTFSFEDISSNNLVAGTYGNLIASGISGFRHNAEIFAYYAIIAVLLFRFHRVLVDWFLENKLIASLPLLALASTAWSQDPFRTFTFAVMAFMHTAFGFYLAKRFRRNQQLDLFFGLGLFALVLSLLLVVLYPAAGVDHKEGMRNAWEGMFGQKNHCALIMTYLLVPAFFIEVKTRLKRTVQIGYIAGTLFLIVMTTSRTGWLEIFLLFCFLGVMRLLGRLEKRERLTAAILITVVGTVLSVLAWKAAPTLAVMLGKDPTLTGRSQIWHAVMLAIYKRPLLGFGYYAFWIGMKGEAVNVAMSIGSTNLGNAENGVLGMWLEMGAAGVALVLLILFQMSRMCVQLFSQDRSRYFGFCLCTTFLSVATLVNGDKFMFPHTLEWTLLVVVFAAMNDELRKRRSERLRA